MSSEKNLFTPYSLGELSLKNRIVMAPMTRSRAPGNVQSPLAAEYYSQRASGGLLITEGTQVDPQGIGYINTPGIHSPEQAAAWKVVTDAVHEAGGLIFAQLWHVGRVSHPDFHGGKLPVAPSAIAAEGEAYTFEGRKKLEAPRALEVAEIKEIVEMFRRAAQFAKDAGFDGVELHGANGYLIEQFLHDKSNQRTDEYGGSIENRSRFALELLDAVISVWGPGRVGIRFSPGNWLGGMGDANPQALYGYLLEKLNDLPLAYVHVMEPFAPNPYGMNNVAAFAREHYKGTLIVNVRYTYETGTEVVANGTADLVAYGSLYLANPDLPERFKANAPLNAPDPSTFYGGNEKGYTDYPTLKEMAVAA